MDVLGLIFILEASWFWFQFFQVSLIRLRRRTVDVKWILWFCVDDCCCIELMMWVTLLLGVLSQQPSSSRWNAEQFCVQWILRLHPSWRRRPGDTATEAVCLQACADAEPRRRGERPLQDRRPRRQSEPSLSGPVVWASSVCLRRQEHSSVSPRKQSSTWRAWRCLPSVDYLDAKCSACLRVCWKFTFWRQCDAGVIWYCCQHSCISHWHVLHCWIYSPECVTSLARPFCVGHKRLCVSGALWCWLPTAWLPGLPASPM